MELDNIEALLEKYFEGETSLAEEKYLREYFRGLNVAPHLQQYRPIFGYFEAAKQESYSENTEVKKRRSISWLSIAASVMVMLGAGFYVYQSQNQNQDLGTFDDPEQAFVETQKALMLLSTNVNKGVNSVEYVSEYKEAKERIFKN